MKFKTDWNGHTVHYYNSDDDFMLNYTPYEHDDITDRYYYLEPSISMTSKAGREGGLVRRRISKADYKRALSECKARLVPPYDAEREERPREELHEHTEADVLRYRADRIESKVPTEGAFVPRISGADMIADFEADLRQQIKNRHYPDTDPRTAAHELYGFKVALNALGVIDGADCRVDPDTFAAEDYLAYICDEICGRGDGLPQEQLEEVYAKCRVGQNIFEQRPKKAVRISDPAATLKYLRKCQDMAWNNRFCYSATYGMNTPKEGYEKKFGEAVRDCEIIDELIALMEAKETPAEQTPPCGECVNRIMADEVRTFCKKHDIVFGELLMIPPQRLPRVSELQLQKLHSRKPLP